MADGDGVIAPDEGERAYLFFGMRRGGSSYYALDVSRPDSPQVLWRLDHTGLPGLGQSWSTPVPTRMRIQGAGQNARSLVLVFGGGYDPSQDKLEGSTDPQGNALFIIDALNGNLLWRAGPVGPDFNAEDMRYSIPADVRVIDLDIDGFADRLYAADMGGQIWRFDVFNGRPPASLISGGVIARLGGAPAAAPAAAETRRFYHARTSPWRDAAHNGSFTSASAPGTERVPTAWPPRIASSPCETMPPSNRSRRPSMKP